jgi:hypothetical protein
MNDFAIINPKELDDSVSARVPGIEGRFGRSDLASEHLGVSHFRYAPAMRASLEGGDGHQVPAEWPD